MITWENRACGSKVYNSKFLFLMALTKFMYIFISTLLTLDVKIRLSCAVFKDMHHECLCTIFLIIQHNDTANVSAIVAYYGQKPFSWEPMKQHKTVSELISISPLSLIRGSCDRSLSSTSQTQTQCLKRQRRSGSKAWERKHYFSFLFRFLLLPFLIIIHLLLIPLLFLLLLLPLLFRLLHLLLSQCHVEIDVIKRLIRDGRKEAMGAEGSSLLQAREDRGYLHVVSCQTDIWQLDIRQPRAIRADSLVRIWDP